MRRRLSAHVSCTITAVVPAPLDLPPSPPPHLTPRAHTMESRPSAVLKSSRQHVHIVCSTRSEAKGHRRRQVEKSDSIFLHLPSSAPPPTPHPSPPPPPVPALPQSSPSPQSLSLPYSFYCTLAIATTKAFREERKEKKRRKQGVWGNVFRLSWGEDFRMSKQF